MAIRYADFIDPQNIEKIIGADYQNEARTVNSGLVRIEGAPDEGTHLTWLKETLFSTDDTGQTLGVGTQITLKNQTQLEYQVPLVWRADGAEFDDIATEIMTKRQREGAEANVTNAISAKSAQMLDSTILAVIDGSVRFIVSNATNYNNANGSQVNLVDIEQTIATRGEKGINFENGFVMMRGIMYHQIAALGLVAATANTMGIMKQNDIVQGGLKGTILGMNPFVTDKISLESTGEVDHMLAFIEAGAVRVLASNNPSVDPIVRGVRSFTDSIKFRVKLGAIIDGLSWSGTKANPATVTNAQLQTASNYSAAATYMKNVPMAVMRCDAPTF